MIDKLLKGSSARLDRMAQKEYSSPQIMIGASQGVGHCWVSEVYTIQHWTSLHLLSQHANILIYFETIPLVLGNLIFGNWYDISDSKLIFPFSDISILRIFVIKRYLWDNYNFSVQNQQNNLLPTPDNTISDWHGSI